MSTLIMNTSNNIIAIMQPTKSSQISKVQDSQSSFAPNYRNNLPFKCVDHIIARPIHREYSTLPFEFVFPSFAIGGGDGRGCVVSLHNFECDCSEAQSLTMAKASYDSLVWSV